MYNLGTFDHECNMGLESIQDFYDKMYVFFVFGVLGDFCCA
jgi:hypothetical protein